MITLLKRHFILESKLFLQALANIPIPTFQENIVADPNILFCFRKAILIVFHIKQRIILCIFCTFTSRESKWISDFLPKFNQVWLDLFHKNAVLFFKTAQHCVHMYYPRTRRAGTLNKSIISYHGGDNHTSVLQ